MDANPRSRLTSGAGLWCRLQTLVLVPGTGAHRTVGVCKDLRPRARKGTLTSGQPGAHSGLTVQFSRSGLGVGFSSGVTNTFWNQRWYHIMSGRYSTAPFHTRHCKNFASTKGKRKKNKKQTWKVLKPFLADNIIYHVVAFKVIFKRNTQTMGSLGDLFYTSTQIFIQHQQSDGSQPRRLLGAGTMRNRLHVRHPQ